MEFTVCGDSDMSQDADVFGSVVLVNNVINGKGFAGAVKICIVHVVELCPVPIVSSYAGRCGRSVGAGSHCLYHLQAGEPKVMAWRAPS